MITGIIITKFIIVLLINIRGFRLVDYYYCCKDDDDDYYYNNYLKVGCY